MNDSEVIFCAFRYCLGRMTYVVSGICTYLFENWDKVEPREQGFIIKEIIEAIEMKQAGLDIDIQCWRDLLIKLSERGEHVD